MLFSVPVLSENQDKPIVNVANENPAPEVSGDKPKNDSANKNATPPAPSPVQAPPSNPPSKSSKKNSESHTPVETGRIKALDLAEQRRMASSAEDAVSIARWQIFVSIVGIGLIFWTLWETRKATTAAKDAAIAAQDATTQNRAWIAITDKSSNWITATDEGGYEIIQGIKNTGGTPGINVRSCVSFHYFPATEPLPEFKPGDWNNIGILPPNGSYFGHTTIPAGSDVLKDTKRRCILHTLIEYETIYNTHKTCVTEVVEEIVLAKEGGWRYAYGVMNDSARRISGESPIKTWPTEFHIFPVGSQQRAT